jgi:hypothetical protein
MGKRWATFEEASAIRRFGALVRDTDTRPLVTDTDRELLYREINKQQRAVLKS